MSKLTFTVLFLSAIVALTTSAAVIPPPFKLSSYATDYKGPTEIDYSKYIRTGQCQVARKLFDAFNGSVSSDNVKSGSTKESLETSFAQLMKIVINVKWWNQLTQCQVLCKVPFNLYDRLVNDMQKKWKIPGNFVEKLREAKLSQMKHTVMRDFLYTNGNAQSVYARAATMRHSGDTIDITFCFFELRFQMACGNCGLTAQQKKGVTDHSFNHGNFHFKLCTEGWGVLAPRMTCFVDKNFDMAVILD